MARRIFEFRCADGHVSEKLIDEHEQTVVCPECSLPANRIISAVRLDWRMGVDADMPTMSDKWARMHREAAKTKED